MFRRWLKILAVAVLSALLCLNPAFAQGRKKQSQPTTSQPKPVGQYILVVILLAVPIGLICRSSRRY